MEALPLVERRLGARVVVRRVPFQHGVGVVEPDGAAVRGQDAGRVVEEVVGVDDADVDLAVVLISDSRGCGVPVDVVVVMMSDAVGGLPVGRASRDLRSDLTDVAQVVEDAPQLVVAGFRGHEVVEAGDAVERRDGAAVVGRDAGARVTDQEGEVELVEDGGRDDGGVVGLGGRGVGVRRLGGVFRVAGPVRGRAPVGLDGGGVGGGRSRSGETGAAFRADTFLGAEERRGDRGRFAVGRDEVVGDVFDKKALALLWGEYTARVAENKSSELAALRRQ